MLSHDLEKNIPNIDIIYSLPAITHSVALASRTPAARFTQKTKYMPDYGGIIETPESCLKNNDLTCKLPFESNSTRFKELILNRETQLSRPIQIPNDCLVAIPSDYDDYFVIVTAQGNNLFVDSIVINNDSDLHDTKPILCKQYSERILGIKLLQKFLAIKFAHSVKLLNLDKFLRKFDDNVDLNAHSSITEKEGFIIRDTCLNQYNKSIQGIAIDNNCLGQVKLYDISSKLSAKQPFLTISWNSEEDNSYLVNEDEFYIIHKTLRGRSIRQFVPISRPSIRGIKQLDCFPSHLVNMIVTTDYKTSLIDPRVNQLAQVYLDKTLIPSFYPIEYLRRTIFSNYNGYQFYSLSNVHLRVFDTRYPGLPINQVNHMLDSETYNSIQMKLINYKDNSLETLCCSSDSRIAFITFDQANSSNLINPKSVHLPYHDNGDDFIDKQLSSFESREPYKMYGLDVRYNLNESSNEILFSTLQLLNNGNILMRDFSQLHSANDVSIIKSEERAKFIMDHTRKKFASFRSNNFQYNYNNNNNNNLSERDIISLDDFELDRPYIDILNSTALLSIEDSFKSIRARERFLKMKANFCP